ncbi:MAG: hypothetical protein IPP88_24510 [Betaproteobacteria bacterium]|nr:hypothetical protein [Betaproteobacteria bacterium]
MKSACNTGQVALLPRTRQLILAGLASLAIFVLGAPAPASAGDLSKESESCLKCHDKVGLEKKLESGETLSLQISTKAYGESMHNETNCEDCHTDIDAKTHGKEKTVTKSKREFATSMRESCRDCHKQKFKEYDDSVHAALIKGGNKKAPMCADCHNPHTVRSWKIPAPIADTPCANCHGDIFKAYSKDVHGLERVAKGKAAPLCADCHKAHNVKAASLGAGIKDACLTCHKNAVKEHQDWLPKSELHFESISCPVCHAPDAQRRVNLRLYDGEGAKHHQLSEKSGVPLFEKRTHAADAKNAGLDERALWSLLKEFNQDGGEGKTVLRGRLEVKSGVEAHQLSEKSKAIKDCKFCHQAGAEPFQSVTLTIAGPDGRPLRHGVQKEVLNSLLSVESIRGFYVIGSTRIKLLDTLLIMVLLGSIAGPLAHMTVKRLFKGFRERRAAEINAAVSAATGQHPVQPLPGDHSDRDGKPE